MSNKNIELFKDLKSYRKDHLRENQTEFWKRFGLTQPGGSRYESGHNIPAPAAILLMLYIKGQLTDEQLNETLKELNEIDNVEFE